MNKEDIIRMAREADMCPWVVVPENEAKKLKRFAALVAAAEREACAKLVESYDPFINWWEDVYKNINWGEDVYKKRLSAAIRARSEK